MKASEAIAKIRAMGKDWNGEILEQTMALYTPELTRMEEMQAGSIEVSMDIAYGVEDLQKLDVYAPTTEGSSRPIVIFVHGGGHNQGDKGTLVYGNVSRYFARNDMVGINANYRLTPQVQWPAQGQDVASVVAWASQHGGEYGGDSNRIFLFGQSAGAAIVANYLFQQELQPSGGPAVAGAILMSGMFTARTTEPHRQTVIDYYGADASKWDERVPLGQAASYSGQLVPIFITNAELNPDNIEQSTLVFYQLLCEKLEQCPRYKQTLGHNHLSESIHLNTDDDSVGPDLLDFIRDPNRSDVDFQ